MVTLNEDAAACWIPVTATLTDPDGSISGLTWQWSITGADAAARCNERLTAPSKVPRRTPTMPKAGDVGGTLTATAMYDRRSRATLRPPRDKRMYYRGNSASGKSANPVAVDTRNKPPVFDDQDTEMDGVQNDTTATRKVEERTRKADSPIRHQPTKPTPLDNVGRPVMATDTKDPNTDPLTYTLGGA